MAKKAVKKTKKTSAKKSSLKNKPKLLSGGNPQITKADGNAPVQAYIKAMPGWKSKIGKRIDILITKAVPKISKAVKWNSPMYGLEGQGWIIAVHCFNKYIKVTFFNGIELQPLPPSKSKHKKVRYLDIYEDAFNERQFTAWAKQASKLPGWGRV